MRLRLFSILFLALFATSASAQTYDLYKPKVQSGKKPVLIFIHGGAWLGGTASQYKSLAEALSTRGLCVAVMNYRLAPDFKHPAPVEDLSQVIAKIKTAQPDGCDTNKLFLSGHSAGAHMIAFWATTHLDPNIRGFIGIEGIYDIPALVSKWPSYKSQFITAEFGDEPKWRAASPTLNKIINRAPWLVLHSTKDELVDVAQSTDFQKHLVCEGLRADLTVLPTGSHFGVVEAFENKSSAASAAFDQFIQSSLK